MTVVHLSVRSAEVEEVAVVAAPAEGDAAAAAAATPAEGEAAAEGDDKKDKKSK
jgi:large subunit ribosomal protein L25